MHGSWDRIENKHVIFEIQKSLDRHKKSILQLQLQLEIYIKPTNILNHFFVFRENEIFKKTILLMLN